MSLLLALLLACAPAPEPHDPPPSPKAPTVEPARAVDPDAATADAEAAPSGTIQAEPILPNPIVVGAISADAVRAGIAARQEAIAECFRRAQQNRPDLAGKVLVRFTIRADGTVNGAATKATSLRHPSTERCVVSKVAEATFEPLRAGRLAVVEFPFTFP